MSGISISSKLLQNANYPGLNLSMYGLLISDDYSDVSHPFGTSFNNCLRTTIVILSVDPFFPIHPDYLWVDVTEWLNIYNNMHLMNWLLCIARVLDEF